MPVHYWFLVLGCFGVGFLFMNIPPVSAQFMHIFGVSYSGLAVFLSALYWTHSTLQVPAGLTIDRIGTVRSFILAASLCIASCLLPFLAPGNLLFAVAMRLLLGVGSSILFLVLVTMAKRLCPPAHISRVQGLQGAAFSFGTMAPYFMLPPFGDSGWVAAYVIGALFPVLLLASLVLVPKKPLKRTGVPPGAAAVWGAVKVIAKSKYIWFLGCCHGFSYGTLTAIGSWLPSILADSKEGSATGDWAVATGAVLLAGTVLRMFSGDISRLRSRQWLLSRAMALVSVFFLALAVSPNPWCALAAGLCLAACCGSTYASVLTLTLDVSAPSYVATAVGFMNMVANLVNVGLILLFGNAREHLGSFSAGLAIAGVCTAGVFLWSRKLDWPPE